MINIVAISTFKHVYIVAKPVQHHSYLFDKANLDALKSDILHFQEQFLTSDPNSNDVESNWLNFKHLLATSIDQNIPKRFPKSNKHLPWITRTIRHKMQHRKQLYNKVKYYQTEEAWDKYHKLKNEIVKEINQAHDNYQNCLFDNQNDTHHKNFWRYIKKLCKDSTGVTLLTVNNKVLHSPKDKAEILNNQFYSVFTKEDLTNIPECTGRPYPIMPPILISTAGIQKLLEEVDTKKASGPDNIPAWVLKHSAREIAPILSKLFS